MPASGPELATAYVSISASTAGLGKQIIGATDQAAGEASRSFASRFTSGIGRVIKTAGKATLVGAGIAAGAAMMGGFKSAIDQETSKKVLAGLYGNAKQAEKAMAGLRQVASKSPIDYSAYTKAAESLAYAGVKGKDATKTLRNVGAAITAAGGSSENMGRATDAILKMVNAGKVQLDTLQQLSDSGVPILSGLAKHFGVSISKVNEMASAGKIGLEDVLSVMQKGTGKTFQTMIKAGDKASKSFGNTFKRVKDNIFTSIGEALVPVLEKATPYLTKAGDAISGFIDGMSSGKGAGGAFADTLKSIWNTVKPLVTGLGEGGGLTGILETMKPYLATIGRIAKDFGSVLAVVADVVIHDLLPPLLRLVQAAYKQLTPGLHAAERVIRTLVIPQLKQFAAAISPIIKWLGKRLLPIVKTVFHVIGVVIKNAMKVVGHVIGLAVDLITGDWSGAWKHIKGIFKAVWDTIKVVLRAALKIVKSLLKTAGQALKAIWDWMWDGIKSATRSAWDKIKGWFSAAWRWVKGAFKGAWSGVKGVLMAPIEWVRDKIKGILGGGGPIRSAFSGALSAIGRIWGGLKDKLSGPVKAALGWLSDHFTEPLNSLLGKLHISFRLPTFSGGGRAATGDRLGRWAGGGVISGPWKGPRADNVLGVSAAGVPTARVNPGEFITNVAATRKMQSNFPGALEYINATGKLPGFGLGGLIGKAWGGLKSAANSVWDAVNPVARFKQLAHKLIGDAPEGLWRRVTWGVAKKAASGVGSAIKGLFSTGAGGPMMKGPHIGGSWQGLWNMVHSRFPGAILTSAYRPGARVAGYGNLSRHGMGKAIDIAVNRKIWDWLVPRRGRLFELLGPWGMWRMGKPWHSAITAANHKDHIHLSSYAKGGKVKPFVADSGAVLAPGLNLLNNKTGKPEPLARTDQLPSELVLTSGYLEIVGDGLVRIVDGRIARAGSRVVGSM